MYKIQKSQSNKLDAAFSYIALTILSCGALLGFMQYLNGSKFIQAGGAILFVLLLVKTVLKR